MSENNIKKIISIVIICLLLLVIFGNYWQYNHIPESISSEYTKENSISNLTADIWISKITVPEMVYYAKTFIAYIEITSNNYSAQSAFIQGKPLVDCHVVYTFSYEFSENNLINIPSNETIIVPLHFHVDSKFIKYIANNSFPTGIDIYQDEFNQNITEGMLYLSRVYFELPIYSYSFIPLFALLLLIPAIGFTLIKFIERKKLKTNSNFNKKQKDK